MITQANLLNAARTSLSAIILVFIHLPQTLADESEPVWGLKPEDRFTVSVSIEKRTDVRIDDLPPTSERTNDRFEIEYRVLGVLENHECLVEATLKDAKREVGPESSAALKATASIVALMEPQRLTFKLDSDGQLIQIDPVYRDGLLMWSPTGETAVSRLLQDACPDDVIASWFERPFWISCHPAKVEEGASWSRRDSTAIGAIGTVRSTPQFMVGKQEDGFFTVEVSGKGRFAPLVAPESAARSKSAVLQNATVVVDEYSGVGRLFQTMSADGTEAAPAPRPQFESLNITMSLHGSGTFQPRASNKPQKVSFQHKQIQSWLLTEHSVGLSHFHLDIPIPAEPR